MFKTPATDRLYRKLDGAGEATLIAVACNGPPDGRCRWTLHLLAEQPVALEVVGSISHECVRQTLKKPVASSSERTVGDPAEGKRRVCRRDGGGVLEVYRRPYDARRPEVYFDEQSKQLVRQVKKPLPMRPGDDAKEDDEYERNGTANLFMLFEPLAGQRQVAVTERWTKIDFAHHVKALADERYPDAQTIVLVLDNLNTHGIGWLYGAFPPDEAWRLAQKIEIHYTPKHGSWLNMAETELGVLTKQCLAPRIPDRQTLTQEVAAWADARNAAKAKVDWQFTTEDARIKLKRLYPTIQD